MASFRNQVGNLCAALFLLSICCIRSLIFTLGNGLPEKASAEILLLLVIINSWIFGDNMFLLIQILYAFS